MKKNIIYTTLLITTLLSAQESRIVKVDKEMGLIYYSDGSVYSINKSQTEHKTTNNHQTIIREIENGEEVEYIIQNDTTPKVETHHQREYIEPPTKPTVRWKSIIHKNQQPIQQPVVEKVEYIIGDNIKTQNTPVQIQPTPIKTHSKKLNVGKVHGHVSVDYNDIEQGSTNNKKSLYYIETGYETPSYKGVNAKVSYYTAGDTGLTDIEKVKYKTNSGLAEAYVKYKGKNLKAKVGRFRLNTPMTDKSSTSSKYYKGAVVSSSKLVSNSTVVGAYISDIKVEGATKKEIINHQNNNIVNYNKTKSRFHEDYDDLSVVDLEDVDTSAELKATLATKAVSNKKSNDVAIAGIINKSIKNTTLQAWEYYAFDVANITYVDGMIKFKMANGVKTMVGAQLIHQSVKDQDGNPMLLGLKGAIGYKRGQIIVAINKSNGDVILNQWGGNAGYTSSAKSRNEYAPDVTAVKFIGKYNIPAFKNIIPKNLQLIVSQASYSKSSDKDSLRDGKETNIVLKYKPKKNLLFVAAYIDKTSDISDDNNVKVSKVAVKYKF